MTTNERGEGMRIAIVGSRDWQDKQAVIDYVNALPDGDTVISGGARGVDTFAEEAVYRHGGLEFEKYPALWDWLGKSAGYIRNQDIVNAASKIVAFHDGKSSGTAHTIKLARKAGKPVEVHYPDGRIEIYEGKQS